jgi:hypothetical protein
MDPDLRYANFGLYITQDFIQREQYLHQDFLQHRIFSQNVMFYKVVRRDLRNCLNQKLAQTDLKWPRYGLKTKKSGRKP